VGTLDRRDLQRFLRHLLGHLRQGELEYFHSRFEPRGSEETELHGVKVALREVAAVADAFYVDHKLLFQAESLKVLNRLSCEILRSEVSASQLVRCWVLFVRGATAPAIYP
jgi:hypothetical protein